MNVIYKRKESVGVKRLEKMPSKINLEGSIFIYSHKESISIGIANYYYYNGNPYDNNTTQLIVI